MPALSLSKLVDLALGTPEVGAVNFNILHSLLHAMIQHLKISDITADVNENDRDFLSGPEKMKLLSSLSGDSGREDSQDYQSDKSGSDVNKRRPPYHQLETKVARLAEQLEQLNGLPTTSELFQQIKATGDTDRPKPMADLWRTMQISKRVGANEEGVGKLMMMIEDLMREMTALKDGYSRMDDLEAQMKKLMEENSSLKDKIDSLGIQDLLDRLNDLDSFTKELNQKFELLPSAEDFASFVTWPILEDALNGVRFDIAELSRKPASPAVPSQTEVPSRPGSSRPSTRLSSASSGPSNQILEILEKLGKVCGEHEVLEKRVEVLEDEMKNKVDNDLFQSSLEGMNLDLLDDLTKQLEQIKTDVANLQNEMQMNREQVQEVPEAKVPDTTDGDGPDMEALMRAQQSIHKLREDVDKLQITTQDIITENDTRTRQIESLFQYCDKLQDVKADKEYVAMEVDVKADKRQLEAKVNHSLFESTTDDINKLIQEIQDKLNGDEFGWKEAITKLTGELESKLDRMELKSLKEWMESRLKALNQKIKQAAPWEDDDAAGLRKQLLQRFHCISCDRPVDIMAGGPVPSIPANNGLPATRSPRPYTTYELDQIRQHAKSLQGGGNMISSLPYTVRQTKELSGQENADFYAPDRPCGGSHTMTYPHKRVTKMSHLSHLFQNEPVIPAPAPVAFKHDSELDILGVDGHIYKGRVKKEDPCRRHPLMATYQSITAEERIPLRPSTSAGAAKPTTTPVPPMSRPRPTSAVPRPPSGGSVTRISSSARLTMRPQSARASSRTGSDTPSPPVEGPRQFLSSEEVEQQLLEPTEQGGQNPSPEPVEVPGESPREESATDEY